MMRTVDVKILGSPVRTILFSIFTAKQKPPSLSLPLHFPLRSLSNTPSRYFVNVIAVSNSPVYRFQGSRNSVSLFTVRAISSSLSTKAAAASVQAQQQQNQNLGESGETETYLEEAKLSLPVQAYFFSTSVDLRSLIEQNKQNFIPPTSLCCSGTGGCISGSECIYMVVFQYGSIVLFNVREHEVGEYLKVVERHAS